MRHLPLRVLSLFVVALMLCGCRSPDGRPHGEPQETATNGHARAWPIAGDVVYTRVGMHFEASRGRYRAYSTNHLGLPKHLPPGTSLTFDRREREKIVLRDENDSEFVITFVEKHSLMTLNEWIARHFSPEPIEMPAGLTDEELKAIAEGRTRRGISREALFLAIGYPPKSLSPSTQDNMLTYEWRRFRSYRIRFDDNGLVSRIGR